MDFLSSDCPRKLRASLLALGEVEVISIYAMGGLHYAWYRPRSTTKKKNDSKGS